jgi:hypothetical protein
LQLIIEANDGGATGWDDLAMVVLEAFHPVGLVPVDHEDIV